MSFRKGKPILLNRGRNRKARPKTFSSEDLAKAHADKEGLKDFKLVNMKSEASQTKKIKIVQ